MLEDVISYLTDKDLAGRQTNSKGEELSSIYLANQLKNIGIQPFYKDYYQSFTFTYVNKKNDTTSSLTLNGTNVVGYINNHKNKTIVLGAHYDHLGTNQYGQSKDVNDTISFRPGADDNASGVALLLSLSKALMSSKESLKANYIVAFFSGEELGLQGSKYMTKQLTMNNTDVTLMLNFDMVGRLNQQRRLVIDGVGTSLVFDSLISITNEKNEFEVQKNQSGVGGSDYTSFYLDSIPVLSFTSGVHSDYHTIHDTKEKINYQGILDIQGFVLNLLDLLEMNTINYQQTKVQKSRSRSSLKVTLGIMPGYGDASGLLIEAVTIGKTADHFGMQKGDIIVGINDCKVNSIYDYMDCLKSFAVGDTAEVYILRNKIKKKIKITFK
jgi:Zn-dependent M28 family amino/carboxypeptidase